MTENPGGINNRSITQFDLTSYSENSNLLSLEDLIHHHWEMFQVSPLFNIEFSDLKLKQYSNKLKNLLSHQDKSFQEIEIDISTNGIKFSKNDPQAFQITVNHSQKTEFLYQGYFFSYGARTLPEDRGAHFTPILLCRGKNTIKNYIHNNLSLFFDCVFTRISLSIFDLEFLTAILISTTEEVKPNEEAGFVYTHSSFSHDENMSLSLNHNFILNLWNSIHNRSDEEIIVDEVESFFYSLKDIFSYQFKAINFHYLNLIKFKCSNAEIAPKSFKIRDPILMNMFLLFLYRKCFK